MNAQTILEQYPVAERLNEYIPSDDIFCRAFLKLNGCNVYIPYSLTYNNLVLDMIHNAYPDLPSFTSSVEYDYRNKYSQRWINDDIIFQIEEHLNIKFNPIDEENPEDLKLLLQNDLIITEAGNCKAYLSPNGRYFIV